MLKSDLNLLIEMLKRETEVAMRTHFEQFKNETEGSLLKKVEQQELKAALQSKVSNGEFWKEIEHIKSMIHSMNREMAVAGIGGSGTSIAASGKKLSSGHGAMKILIK